MLDLTADKTSGEPAIQMFTLKGGDFITNKYPGVGGLDGLSSGIVQVLQLHLRLSTGVILVLEYSLHTEASL